MNEKMCEICKKPESKWDMSESPFAFVYTTKDSCTEKYYCPSCLTRRLLKVLKDNKQEGEADVHANRSDNRDSD